MTPSLWLWIQREKARTQRGEGKTSKKADRSTEPTRGNEFTLIPEEESVPGKAAQGQQATGAVRSLVQLGNWLVSGRTEGTARLLRSPLDNFVGLNGGFLGGNEELTGSGPVWNVLEWRRFDRLTGLTG
jgi:hypothetical protein